MPPQDLTIIERRYNANIQDISVIENNGASLLEIVDESTDYADLSPRKALVYGQCTTVLILFAGEKLLPESARLAFAHALKKDSYRKEGR